MFYPHNFLEQFLSFEVCSRETLDVLCKNAFFAITGVDIKNLNMVLCPEISILIILSNTTDSLSYHQLGMVLY